MDAFERIAESRITEAVERGDLDNLPGAGLALDLDDGSEFIAPELRSAYRLLKNAGYVPQELILRREIADARELLSMARSEEERLRVSQRLEMLLLRVGSERALGLQLQECYYQALAERVSGGG